MNDDVNLKEVERKIYSSYYNDGLWDIYGGLVLLGFGLDIVTGNMMALILCLALGVAVVLIRQPVVVARLGSVKFSPQRRARTLKYKAAALILGSAFLMLGAALAAWFSADAMPAWLDAWVRHNFFIFMGGMLAAVTCVAAYLSGARRYYGYALVIFIAFWLSSLLRSRDLEGIPIVAAAGLILACGAWVLFRFLSRNPPQEGN